MAAKYDLLIQGARVIDPASGLDARRDLAVAGTAIAEVAEELDAGSATRVIDGRGQVLMPGIVDSHVHIFNRRGTSTHGHRALARAGVTTTVEYSNMIGVMDQWPASAAGLTVLGVEALPAYTGPVSREQIRDAVAGVVKAGAIGPKIFGGHYPSTPEASAQIIDEANEQGVYVAFHAGSTEHPSNLEGLREMIALAGKNSLHVAHTPAYLRGMVADPIDENLEALDLLRSHPWLVSEAHLGPLNGCTGRLENGIPVDHVCRNCLKMRGYSVDEAGLRQAFIDGYAHVNEYVDDGMVQYSGEPALKVWEANKDLTRMSFPVNLRITAYMQTCARVTPSGAVAYEGPGEFVVDAISSDGGNWRNVILHHGLDMMAFGALTLGQFAYKASLRPAQMYGIHNKGHLTPGADADLVLVDLPRKAPSLTVARGQIIFDGEKVVGKGGVIGTTAAGAKALAERGIPYEVVDLSRSLFYTKGR